MCNAGSIFTREKVVLTEAVMMMLLDAMVMVESGG